MQKVSQGLLLPWRSELTRFRAANLDQNWMDPELPHRMQYQIQGSSWPALYSPL